MAPDNPHADPDAPPSLLPFTGASSENIFDLPYADDPSARAALPPPPDPGVPPSTSPGLPPPPAEESTSSARSIGSAEGDPSLGPPLEARFDSPIHAEPGPREIPPFGADLAPPAPPPPPASPPPVPPASGVVDPADELPAVRTPRAFLPSNFSTPSSRSSPSTPISPAPVPEAVMSGTDRASGDGPESHQVVIPPPIDAQYLIGDLIQMEEDGDRDPVTDAQSDAGVDSEAQAAQASEPGTALPPMVARSAGAANDAGPTGAEEPTTTNGSSGGFSFAQPSRDSTSRRRPSIRVRRAGNDLAASTGPADLAGAPVGPLTMSPDAPIPVAPQRPSTPGSTLAGLPTRPAGGPSIIPPLVPGAQNPSPPPPASAPAASAMAPPVSIPGAIGPGPTVETTRGANPTAAASVGGTAEPSPSRVADGVLVGMAGAALAGCVWWLVVAMTQRQFPYLSILLGALVGQAVLVGSRKGSATLAGLAGVLTLISLSISQYFIARSLAISELGLDVPLWDGAGNAMDVIKSAYQGDALTAVFVVLAAGVAVFSVIRRGARPAI